MAKTAGTNVKVRVSRNVDEGDFLVFAGQRDCTLNTTIDELDASSKDETGGWNVSLAGARSWDISVSGAFVFGDTGLAMIEESIYAVEHTPDLGRFNVEIFGESGTMYRGIATVTSFSKSFPNADLITYDISLNGAGALTPVLVGASGFGNVAQFANASEVKEQLEKAVKTGKKEDK